MPIKYKFNVLNALKSKGYNPQRLRNEKLLGESTIQSLRHNKSISFSALETICKLLNFQPGDILEWVDDGKHNDSK